MGVLDQLQADVAAQKTVIGGAIALLQGVNDKLLAAGSDAAALQGLRQEIEKQTADLAAAVAQNTPAAPETPPQTPQADPQQQSGGGTAA